MMWSCATARNLPIDEDSAWDGGDAASSIFEYAGWPDGPNPAKARKGFLAYDMSADHLKSSYKLPIAMMKDGVMTASKAGVNAAASRLKQTSIPNDCMGDAQAVIDLYQKKMTPAEGKMKNSSPMPSNLEYRDCVFREPDSDRVEFRALDPMSDKPGFDGYIATWNTVDDRGTFFVQGSAKKTLKESALSRPVLWQHDPWTPIGKHNSAVEDDKGIRVSAAISPTVAGQDCMTLLRDGVPMGLSFGFIRTRDRSATDADKLDLSVAPDFIQSLPRNELRAITEFAFWESSPVTYPANALALPDNVRSAAGQQATAGELALLMTAIKDGSLTPEQEARCMELVEALEARAAEKTRTRDEQGRRNRGLELEALFADIVMEQVA